jgi:hypothetical protein
MVPACARRRGLDRAARRAIGSVSPVGCPSVCFTAALDALEIQSVRTPAYPVIVTEEPALHRKPTRDLHAQGYLRHLDPNCLGDGRQNGCFS